MNIDSLPPRPWRDREADALDTFEPSAREPQDSLLSRYGEDHFRSSPRSML
jgi:hypothetical protein